jgi:hypothetical protein
MSSIDQAYETQLNNIQKKTGKSMEELAAIIHNSGLTKHSEIRAMLQRDLDLGYGDANTLVHLVLKTDGTSAAQASGASIDDVLGEIYSGPKAELRPIHDRLMDAINQFGEFEIAPKKGYVSLRRKKQFAMIGPAAKTRLEVGLNLKGVEATERLVALPPGGMCPFKVNVTRIEEVDAELISWIKGAYESAG